jgi:hypothetical protein
MKKLLNLLIGSVLLTFIEFIILIIIFSIEDKILYDIPLSSFSGLKAAFEVITLKFLFYTIIWILVVYFFYDNLEINRPFLKLAIYNCGLYISISIFMTMLMPFTIEFFFRSFFLFVVIATFISPFILSLLPQSKKLFIY